MEPKTGRHFTTATPNRSGAEFARIVGHVVEQYPAASTIHLVMDNLNIHTRKSLTDYFGEPEGGNILGPAHRALHPETRKLAQSSGNRTQPVRAAMSGQPPDSGSEEVEAGNQGLEPSGQPEANEDQLAVHAEEGPKGVQVQSAPPPTLTATAPEYSPTELRVTKPRRPALKKPQQEGEDHPAKPNLREIRSHGP